MSEQPKKSIKYFCENLIDYAGLFPPAKLSLSEAFGYYIKYRSSNYKWILSNFICPVKMFQDLKNLIQSKHPDEKDINISVLGRGGHDLDDFKNNFQHDVNTWKDFISESGNTLKTNTFEIKLHNEIIANHNSKKISQLIDFISDTIQKNISQPVFIFFEEYIGSEWKKDIKCLINGIEIHNEGNPDCGYKLRTGGVEPYTFPNPEKISYCIRECIDRQIKMKFTAGLHHPFRHFDKELSTKMYGFINIFGAGIIAMRHNITNFGIKEILVDENPKNFIFTDESFSWKDWTIGIEDIDFARKNLVLSFGSCSFDDPTNDLKSFNLL
ncbi:MAG: hypothetical protein M3R36_13735 [Bacteroidota bacterium]|nr:hypothetical protein [Bacteroidota bacterium]